MTQYTYQRDKTRGSVLQTVGQTVAWFQGQKDIYGYQTRILLVIGVIGRLPERARRSRLLKVPQKIHV